MRDEQQSAHLQQLTAKLRDRTAVIGIIGLGYVGLPLTLRYAAVGFRVLGIDIDTAKVDKLNRGESYIEHIPAEAIGAARKGGFEATSDFTRAGEPDVLIICGRRRSMPIANPTFPSCSIPPTRCCPSCVRAS